ncbi:MAG: 3-deoxy-7-phosphoheptulonate synthase [Deltaproteobacteria bacterium]|nr:3-deoxy-7-phosphoheptulonate synthase [Deltaproteobacteria bacterium]
MIITLSSDITPEQLQSLSALIGSFGYKLTEVKTQGGRYLVAVGSAEFDIRLVGKAPGVSDVHRVSDAYKLVSRKWRVTPTVIDLGGETHVHEGDLTLIAGPCAIESEEQVRSVVSHLKRNGVAIMRGGAFKPRTSPYAFRGLGLEGLKMFHSIASQAGIKVISEVVSPGHIAEMYPYIDIFQVGARNSQNFDLLGELGKVDKPVLLKRAMAGTLEELLQSAEYIFSSGNEKLILCERGVRTSEPSYRNALDLNAIPALKEKSHLPVIVDPSHGVGVRRWVEPVALAAIMAGADGIIFEVHKHPEEALSDGAQTLNYLQSERLIRRARAAFQFRRGL